MREINFSMRAFAAASALFLATAPALAGDEERALAAIAQAQGKIDAAAKLKAGDFDPAVLAQAQASLRLAQEQLKSGKEQAAIRSAVDAQQFADTAIGESRARTDADAHMHAATATAAQQDAAAANARADAAERAAASAAADARAARAAAVIPAPATTTVTTETVKTAPVITRKAAPVKRKVVRKSTAPARTSVVEKPRPPLRSNDPKAGRSGIIGAVLSFVRKHHIGFPREAVVSHGRGSKIPTASAPVRRFLHPPFPGRRSGSAPQCPPRNGMAPHRRATR